MPFETTDSENIVAAVSAGKHNENLPAGFSDQFKQLLDGMFKISSKTRLSIGQILNEPLIKRQVIDYVNSDIFKSQFKESRKRMNMMKEDSQDLYKVEMTDQEIEEELKEYTKKITK